MEEITYDFITKNPLPHVQKELLKDILICQYSVNKKLIDRHKVTLFRRMSFLVSKQVNNFFFLARNHNKEIFHTKDEIVTECFIILDKCVGAYDWRNNKTNFFFYYNKALSREIIRLFGKHYIKHENTINLEPKHVTHLCCEQDHGDLIHYYLASAKLDDKELRIVEARLTKQKMKEFHKKNKDIGSSVFHEHMASIKNKLNFLKDGEDTESVE